MKKVLAVYSAPNPHWVGDGFPVRTLFTYNNQGKQLSPFLLLDYAGPKHFSPTDRPRGVGEHPHRGFETVTLVYQGEVAHADSTGQGGVIGPGDVQWMTAGAGILHEEFHSPAFSQSGGELEMVQLWVNLPARDKRTPPAYQAIVAQDIPVVNLSHGENPLRVIAGEFAGHTGPAKTFTPMNVWDMQLKQESHSEFTLPEGWAVAIIVLQGTVQINGDTTVHKTQLSILDSAGQKLTLKAESDAMVLLLSGEPIEEPLVGHGPFVMNTREEIDQAISDFQTGQFGKMTH